MPWSGCNTTSEFIELMNFGPGPMDIGCFIVTNGIYSVTIPPNTVLQRGQYFILSGQNILSKNCGNMDSAVHVDLNWTTCNCTNVPVPTTGDGFLKNGGSANEKIILLDPNLNVIDAVSRSLPVSSSTSITTPNLGGCASKTFDLTGLPISYETINNSTGIDNSFARKVDGDCGWVKTTVISAHAPNKTGSTSSATYDFTAVSTTQCNNTTGSISIQVNASDLNALFPMNYTMAFDVDGDDVFTSADQYIYGIDNMAPSIDISNLAYGRYRITVGSSSSCNLKSYDFYVFNCYTVVLPVKLLYFTYDGDKNGSRIFKFKVDAATALSNVVLEAGDGRNFQPVSILYGPFNKNEITISTNSGSYTNYRLRLTNYAGVISYSQQIKINSLNFSVSCWPNPVKDDLFIKIHSLSKAKLSFTVLNASGVIIKTNKLNVGEGEQVISIPLETLKRGIYYLKLEGSSLTLPFSLRFIK